MTERYSCKRVGTFALALLAAAGWLCLSPAAARAQNTNSGTVTGQVTDAQGKAIVGAVVLLTNQATNGALPTVTNSAGRYIFVNLQPGTYTLDVKKDGFKEAAVKNEAVPVGKPVTINVPMQVGAATQTVEVTASGAELQTMNATVGDTVSQQAIQLLPAFSRDANSLTMLQPNTQPDGGVGGADSDQNTFSLDGGQNSNDMDGNNADYTPSNGSSTTSSTTSGVMPTPAASIETFTVGVSNQSADVNSAAGSSVAMVTKRGTDTFHGEAYEYYLGSDLSANAWYNNQSNVPRESSHRNRFGLALGGEILPNFLGGKTYLFGNYEALRYPLTESYSRAVPTALLRAGVVQAACGTSTCYDGNGVAPSSEGAYNLNPTSVTVGSVTYAPAVCTLPSGGTGACDPEGLGLNPVIAQEWKQYLPLPNTGVGGDGFNTLNYQANLNDASSSNFFVTRLDHDFGAKNHFTLTYHHYSLNRISTAQVDIGGALPGDTFGDPSAPTTRPILPSMWTAQLTSSLTPDVTNNFNYSYLRNWWQWGGTVLTPPALSGFGALGGTLEIGGETSNAQIPFNVNTQSVRTRFWDGIGNTFADDVTVIHGNHVFQFGGKYTHQWDYHSRNDNGGSVMANTVYQVGNGVGSAGGPVNFDYLPTEFTSNADTATFGQYEAEALGIVTEPQVMYTRSGADLSLQPLGTPMFDQSYIPLYNVYLSDAWHIKPSLTLDAGTGYTIEMPPHEAQGKQVSLVDSAGNPIDAATFLADEERANLAGQSYAPELGFATVNNIGGGEEYPYHPFYGGISPRLSLAWNPNISGGAMGWLFGGNKAVIRGGWSRIYGRLNGVDLVLVPLLGTGLAQAVQCIGASASGQCLGAGAVDPSTAFRIGPTTNCSTSTGACDNGLTAPLGAAPSATLPQPYYPGEIQNGAVTTAAGSGEFLDPNFRPDRSDEFDLTIQRQLSQNFTMELGYTGRIIRNEYQAINLDAVPIELTAGGQQFMQAYANLDQEVATGKTVTAQPFFEAALGGTGSAYCTGFTSCTAAVAATESKYIDNPEGNDVYSMWSDISGSSSWALGRTTPSSTTTCNTPGTGGCPANGIISPGGQLSAIFDNVALGWGNYNSLFWSVQMRNWHSLTLQSNLTWSHSLGTGQVDQATSEYTVSNPFDIGYDYGPQFDNVPLNYNLYFIWQPGSQSQHGLMGHLLNGWAFAPIVTWRTYGNDFGAGGSGTGSSQVNGGIGDSWGESNPFVGSSAQEDAIPVAPYTGGSGIVHGVQTTGSIGSAGNVDPASGLTGTQINRFSNPATVYDEFRPPVLGLDTTATASYVPGLSGTDVDFSVTKNLAISERFSTQLNAQATNLFNHFTAAAPYLDLTNPTQFGVITQSGLDDSAVTGYARTVELGLTVSW